MAYNISSGETSDGIILGNDSMTVYDGGTVVFTSINAYGRIKVLSGGTANSTTINSGGRFEVGGTANNTVVNSGGSLHILISGIATDIIENGGYVEDKGRQDIIYAPNSFSGLILSDSTASATVHSGTTANFAEIRSGGVLHVFSGGITNNNTVKYSGIMIVSSGGTANSTTVTSDGRIRVLSGGIANSVFVRSGGGISISSGGKLTGKVIGLYGIISAKSGAIVDFDLTQTLPGAASIIYWVTDSGLFVDGKPTYTITVNSDQAEGLYSLTNYAQGFNGQITVLNTSGAELGVLSVGETITISDTAYTLNITDNTLSLKIGENITPLPYTSDGLVIDRQNVSIASGEVYHDTSIWGGQLNITSGGTADIVSLHPFNAHGEINVSQGGSANSVTVNSICSMFVSSYGTVNGATVKANGYLHVFREGKITGKMMFESGAIVSVDDKVAIVNFDLTQTEADAEALINDLSVIQGTPKYTLTVDARNQAFGSYSLAEGAADFNGTITVQNTSEKKLGNLTVGSSLTVSGIDYALNLTDDVLSLQITAAAAPSEIINGIVIENETRTVNAGQAYMKTTVNDGGMFYVAGNGTADDTTVNSGGRMYVNSAGIAAAATVNTGGRLEVSSGGTASGVTVLEGGSFCFAVAPDTYVQGTRGESAFEMKDGVISGYAVIDARLQVSGGGVMNNAVIQSNGVVWVSSGGIANGATIGDSGRLTLSSGGIANGAIINEKGNLLVEGGKADDTIVNESGFVTVKKNGVADNTTINAGGSMYVNSAGSAFGAAVNAGGRLEVSSGGTASGIEVLEGGSFCFAVAPDTYVQGTQGGSSFEMTDGVIAGYTVLNGRLQISEGGIMNDAVVDSGGAVWVSSGGIARGVAINASGTLSVSAGGIATDVAIQDKGCLRIDGGRAGNTVVRSGGMVLVQSDGTITGKMTLESGAYVSAANGAVLNFDLTQAEAGGEALVNDLTLIKGNPSYSITVSKSQAEGQYTLASGAVGFNSTISVRSASGTDLGTLDLGETIYIGNDSYTLALSDDDLILTVMPPTITNGDGDVLLANLMPEAEYMYGCAPTALSMILGYYDLYGYRGSDLSNMIEGDVDLKSRGTDGNIFNMNAFDTVLGHATATEDFVYRFYSRDSIDSIVAGILSATPTTPEEELEYSFVNNGEGPDLRTDVWNCIADYIGTGQFWRNNENLSTMCYHLMMEQSINDDRLETITDEATGIQRSVEQRYLDLQYGLYLYVQEKGYSLDMKVTGAHQIDAVGGYFTFEDYMKEIDAGRPVLVLVEGHVMTGYGYNAETREIIFDNCYYADERMVWDGTYEYAGQERKLNSIMTIGIMQADDDVDLAVSPFDEDSGISEKMIVSTTENQLVSVDYCFLGSPLYLSFAVSNLGSSPSGEFDTLIYIDDEEKEMLPGMYLEAETRKRIYDVPLVVPLDVGLHSIGIKIDPDNVIQETSCLNNIEERSLMVLKEGTNVVQGTLTVDSGEVTSGDYVMNGAGIQVLEGGTAEGTLIQGKFISRDSNGGITTSAGIVNVSRGGLIRDAEVYEFGQLQLSGTAENISVLEDGNAVVFDGGRISKVYVAEDGILTLESGGELTGPIQIASRANVEFEDGAILNFDLTQAEAGGEALVNDLSIIKGTPLYTLTVDGTEANGVYSLADGAADFTGTISVANADGTGLGTLTVGETITVSDKSYLLTNENGVLSVTVTGDDTPSKSKWTYLVYMAADNDLCYSALYDIVSMQQAKVDSQIDIYILADRTPAGTKGSGDYETINGTYKWGSDWDDTRVGRITYSPGLTVTVDWTSWGELDTGSIATLKQFVDWAQAESPAENYGLIVWDHGEEDTKLCWDLTTDPDWDAYITVSEVAGLLKEKGNIPLVIFNNCLLGSELVATQMAGSTDVIVVSEPSSYGMSTFNFNMFFRMLTPDMTPQEMAALMVRNVELQSEYVGEPTMLTSVDVTGLRLGDALEALAVAVSAAGNDADKDVLIHAMLQAPQDGSDYDGTDVQQSDLGFMIRDVLADPDYEKTSEGFRKALADVSAALEAVVLDFRSVPAKRGSGIAVCNPVYTAKELMTSGYSPEAADVLIQSYLTSTYGSNPLWGGLLNDLCATYLAEIEAARVPTAVFSDSEVSGLVDGRTVTVSDLGGFSGRGELFDCIKLRDERFFGFVITAADKSTGSFTIASDIGAAITVSLLAADGAVISTDTGSVSFQDLAVGTYYLRLQSDKDCRVTLATEADWWTGVDRFECNDTCETAAALDTGYHTGLITCEGDPDYYLIGNYDALMYTVEVYGEEGWTVGEYDPDDGTIYEADYADGKYTTMMGSMGCLLVEGTADLKNGVDAYSVNVIPYESEWPVDITLDDLVGTKDGVSWEPSILMNKYYVEYSPDDFEHTMRVVTTGTAVDMLNLPSGTYQWRVTTNAGKNPEWFNGEKIVSDNTTTDPSVFRSSSDANDDLFFAAPNGTWSSLYCAKHVGSVGDWSGTNELVSAAGKGRIQDLFFGSADSGTLYLTDSDNGDALFLDDVYTGLPEEIEENTARLFRLRKIIAGAGDDIVDMTSQRFEYTGGALVISGGDGNDVIWANRGARNSLFGDAGNDRIVGASGDDVIVGGIGDDSMHGGGGDDIFTFCENWGTDTVEQLETGSVTLWFRFGSMENWDEKTLTYSDGAGNSVTVSGVSADRVSLKFESAGSKLFATLINMGAFAETSTKKIFNDTDKGLLASV